MCFWNIAKCLSAWEGKVCPSRGMKFGKLQYFCVYLANTRSRIIIVIMMGFFCQYWLTYVIQGDNIISESICRWEIIQRQNREGNGCNVWRKCHLYLCVAHIYCDIWFPVDIPDITSLYHLLGHSSFTCWITLRWQKFQSVAIGLKYLLNLLNRMRKILEMEKYWKSQWNLQARKSGNHELWMGNFQLQHILLFTQSKFSVWKVIDLMTLTCMNVNERKQFTM